jgi:hypothetical protein
LIVPHEPLRSMDELRFDVGQDEIEDITMALGPFLRNHRITTDAKGIQ